MLELIRRFAATLEHVWSKAFLLIVEDFFVVLVSELQTYKDLFLVYFALCESPGGYCMDFTSMGWLLGVSVIDSDTKFFICVPC